MALGFVAARRYADAVAPFLSYPDVDGQVLKTLIEMKAPGYTREAISLLHSDKVWLGFELQVVSTFSDEILLPTMLSGCR
jgi:hypothetical protein